MKLNIIYSNKAEEYALEYASSANMNPPCCAELIFGKFSDEEDNHYNLAFPCDYKLDDNLPYFLIGSIKVIITNSKIVDQINNTKLDFINYKFVFQQIA